MTDSDPQPAPATRDELAAADFVRLTTFRRDGRAVPTAVWVVADGDDLLVTTLDSTGKVKRIRRAGDVELTICSRRGEVAGSAVPTPAHATLDATPETRARLDRLLVQKYGWQARAFGLVQLVTGRSRHRIGVRIRVA